MFIEHLILYKGWAKYWIVVSKIDVSSLKFYDFIKSETLNCTKFCACGSISKYVWAEEVPLSLKK